MCKIVDTTDGKTVIKYRSIHLALDHAKKANDEMGVKRFIVKIGEAA